MPRRREQWLSLAEWLVLCLVSQEPSHGFALAAVLAPDGEVGMVWHVRKAVVYRAAQWLERLGLITAEDKEHSRLGPPRAPLSAPAEGHRAAQGWLSQPDEVSTRLVGGRVHDLRLASG
jgi:PadR family transcriptional regulator AphA